MLEKTAQVTLWKGNTHAAFSSRTCHVSIALHSKEMDTWKAQSNSSLNYIVFQLKITIQVAGCLSKMTIAVVYDGENLPIPENLLQILYVDPSFPFCTRVTHIHWWFYVSCICKCRRLQSSWLNRPPGNSTVTNI